MPNERDGVRTDHALPADRVSTPRGVRGLLRPTGETLLTLLLAGLGGLVATWLGMPAAWLAGAMMLVAIAGLAGLPVDVPPVVRNPAFTLLGASMGAAVTPETVNQMITWPISIVILVASMAATIAAGTLYLERVHGWDPVTARYSSVPGALSAVLILAASNNADVPRVALAQSIRLFTLVAIMPNVLTLMAQTGQPVVLATVVEASWTGDVVVLAASAAGAWLLHRLNVPGGPMLGAMIVSAVIHGAGLIHGRLSTTLMMIGFVATGALIGSRFRGTSLAVLRGTLRGAFESVFVALLLSAGFAGLACWWLGLPFGQLWLSYAPGGVEAMAVMALALNLDAAFVGAHHVIRFMGLNLLSPLWTRRVKAPENGTE